MTHTLIYDPETLIVEVHVEGIADLSEMKAIFSDGVKLAAEQGHYLVLSDFREATIKLSTLEIYELPKILAEISSRLGVNAHKYKRAIVTAEDSEDQEFAETTTRNRGQIARFFHDIGEARAWLLAES
jgi:hypothetical protein